MGHGRVRRARTRSGPDVRTQYYAHTAPGRGHRFGFKQIPKNQLKISWGTMAKLEIEDENPPLEDDAADPESLYGISGLSGERLEPQLSPGYDIASADSEEALLRRLAAVEENVFSQMLDILREEGTKVLDEGDERHIIQSLDKENLRRLILQEFTRLALRESESSQRKLTGTTQESSDRQNLESLECGQPMRLAANGAAGNQGSLGPSQSTSSPVSLEQAIAGLWPELQRNVSLHPHDSRR